MKKLISLSILVVVLAACAPPIEASRMSIDPLLVENLPPNKFLKDNITLGEVTVADSVQSAVGAITPDNLRRALLTTLMQSGFYQRDNDSAKYTLSAHLLKLEQDTFGFEMSAIASIEYILKNQKTKKTVYSEVISVPYTADIGDAFDGLMRARLATEKAISENMMHLLMTLTKKKVK